jgi:hypothetical protein
VDAPFDAEAVATSVEVSAEREFIRTFDFEAASMAGRLTEDLVEFNKRQALVAAHDKHYWHDLAAAQ